MKKYVFIKIILCLLVINANSQHSEIHPDKVQVPSTTVFPLSPANGTLFFDDNDKQMKYFNGTPFLTGITNQDAQNSQLIFKVPMDAPSTLYYVCMFHFNSMKGQINIL
jgi:hypothetical protein